MNGYQTLPELLPGKQCHKPSIGTQSQFNYIRQQQWLSHVTSIPFSINAHGYNMVIFINTPWLRSRNNLW